MDDDVARFPGRLVRAIGQYYSDGHQTYFSAEATQGKTQPRFGVLPMLLRPLDFRSVHFQSHVAGARPASAYATADF